jgi:hypothetical protein
LGAIVVDKDLLEWLEKNLSRQLQWISAADSKTPSIYAFDAAMLGALVALISSKGLSSVVEWVCAVTAGAFLLTSFLFITISTLPRRKGPKHSLIFFGGIAERTCEEFEREVRAVTETILIEDFAKQCHRNAQIASAKYKWIHLSMKVLYLAIVPWLLVGVLLLLKKAGA